MKDWPKPARNFALLTTESVVFGVNFCPMLACGQEVEAFRWSFKPAWNFKPQHLLHWTAQPKPLASTRATERIVRRAASPTGGDAGA